MAKPIVAIVGRPNVGKSTLFNKIAGRRIAIVEDTPGVTRDRIYADAQWSGKDFTMVDTGGIEPESNDNILSQMRSQAEIAIDTADVIIFVVNVHDGLTGTDAAVASMLQKSGKPVVLACNKCDSPGAPPMQLYEFYNLGIGDPIPVSAIHGMGTGDLLDLVIADFPEDKGDEEDDSLKIAIVGKPNAGKSSLVNKILGQDRVIVSPIAGTTRDSIDTVYEKDGKRYTLIDTAGMRKRGKIGEDIERYSVIRALNAIERADVVLIMIDGSEGISEQDTKIAGYAHDNGKASIIAVNKWDAVEKDDKSQNKFREDINNMLSFMTYAPIMFISAKTGQRVNRLFDMFEYVSNQSNMRVTTGALNDCINEATAKTQPPSDKGKRLKVFYATQASVNPPTFILFVNNHELFHFSYLRYIENQIRTTFGFEGTPLKFIIREREEKNK